jgi:hypothetical protein
MAAELAALAASTMSEEAASDNSDAGTPRKQRPKQQQQQQQQQGSPRSSSADTAEAAAAAAAAGPDTSPGSGEPSPTSGSKRAWWGSAPKPKPYAHLHLPGLNPREPVPGWMAPQSPYGLLEEELWQNPWQLLLGCMLLNKTSGKQVRPTTCPCSSVSSACFV